MTSSTAFANRAGISRGSRSGRPRYSQWNRHSRARMLRAVPPWIVPTWIVVAGGSNRPEGSPRSIIRSAMRLSAATRSQAAETALAPSSGREECASRPWTVVRQVTMLLCASATSRPSARRRCRRRGGGRPRRTGRWHPSARDRWSPRRRRGAGGSAARDRRRACPAQGPARSRRSPSCRPRRARRPGRVPRDAQRVKGSDFHGWLARYRHHVGVAREDDAAL